MAEDMVTIYALQGAEDFECVNAVDGQDYEIFLLFDGQAWKFTTRNEGASIRVRGGL